MIMKTLFVQSALSYIYPQIQQKHAFNPATDIDNLTPGEADYLLGRAGSGVTPHASKINQDPKGRWNYKGSPMTERQVARINAISLSGQQAASPDARVLPPAPAETEAPPATIDPAAAEEPNLDELLGQMGQHEQQQPSASIPQLAENLSKALNNFGKAYNKQIRTYNPAIQVINQALKSLSGNPNVQYKPEISDDIIP